MQSCPELGQGEGDHFDGVDFRTRRLLRGSKRTSLEPSETLRMANALNRCAIVRQAACLKSTLTSAKDLNGRTPVNRRRGDHLDEQLKTVSVGHR